MVLNLPYMWYNMGKALNSIKETKNMQNLLSSRKLPWVFAVVGIIVVALAIAGSKYRSKSQGTAPTNTESKVVTTNIAPSQLPDKFPSDIPQESGAAVLKNDVQFATDGRFQATRSYVTAKSLDENIKIFRNYFQTHGWTLTTNVDQPLFKSISATKGDLNMQVSINDNQLSKQKTVDIYVVQKVGQ